jgi:ribosomal protein S18 acetylase RimI-like enzyme
MPNVQAGLVIRQANEADAKAIVTLIGQLAGAISETSTLVSALTAEYVCAYLRHPGCAVLLAERDGAVLGLLSLTMRPNLYHAADCCLIEEFIVDQGARSQGIGGALVKEAIRRAGAQGCAEISVSTMPDNTGAARFYRAHGLTDEALLLERHL